MLTSHQLLLRSLSALSLAAAAACATAPPRRAPQPDLTLPADWTAASPAASPTSPASPTETVVVPIDWWTTFGDATLTALIDEALAHNRDLDAAAARVELAAATARVAGAALAPQVSGGFDASRSRRNFIGFPIPGSDEAGSVVSTTSNNLGVSLNVSWEPDLWGRLRSGEVAALSNHLAATAQYAGARLSLASQTAKAWLAVVEASQQVEVAERALASRRDSVTRVGVRYESGLRPSLDVRQAQAAEATADAGLAARRRVLDQAIRQLEVLVGRYPSGALSHAAALPALEGPVPVGLPADLIARRPDLFAAEMQLVATGAGVSEARAALLPQIRLTTSVGTASAALLDLLKGDFTVWSLVAGLTQPLFQGGRLRANVDAASARRDEAIAVYAQSALRAFAEVEVALSAEQFLVGQERALERSFAEAVAARQLAEDRYFAGLSGYLEVLDGQRQALTAESQWLEARRLRLATRVDLYLALGGGFVETGIIPPSPPAKEFRP
jgi:NodT family efflux transporter outer membrane factor (OMF) lipoprotein